MKLRFTSEPKESWFELCILDESKVIFQDLQQQQQPISAAPPPAQQQLSSFAELRRGSKNEKRTCASALVT